MFNEFLHKLRALSSVQQWSISFICDIFFFFSLLFATHGNEMYISDLNKEFGTLPVGKNELHSAEKHRS